MDASVKVFIIAAVAENGVIGRNGELPWRLKSDLQRFKRLTYGKTVIVGRKTHESILKRLGHPLEGRRTIVVTRNHSYASECEVVHSLEEALERAKNDDEVFVIGGAEFYDAALPYAHRLCLTRVHAKVDGDTFFPISYRPGGWQLVDSEFHHSDAENEYDFTFEILERIAYVSPADEVAEHFVHLAHARHDDQRRVMEEIQAAGVCPFCAEHRGRFPLEPALWEGRHWVLVPNRWPYRFTQLHLMAVLNRHTRMLSELTGEEWDELHRCISWAEQTYNLENGAVGIRFGDPAKNGATVEHLHVHLIVADLDMTKPGYERVRFPMGPKPPESETKNTPGS